MKVSDIAIRLSHSCQKVRVLDSKSRRVCFDGTADALLDYSGADYRSVTGIDLDGDVIVILSRVPGGGAL